jgi:D-alanyl-D-alanine dipeptidase
MRSILRQPALFPLAALLACMGTAPAAPKEGTDFPGIDGIVDAQKILPALKAELKYATADNFLHRNIYGDLRTCYLHRDAAEMLAQAHQILRRSRPDLTFLAYDCLRPRRLQWKMWEAVKGTDQESFVANPGSPTGSVHNYGCAIDLTLAAREGRALDMGTPFDFFGPEAKPTEEPLMLRKGKLTKEQLANRLLLRSAMVQAGFLPISDEWWHFDCAVQAEVRRRFKIVE